MRSENEKRAADTARSPVVSSTRPATPGEPDPNTARGLTPEEAAVRDWFADLIAAAFGKPPTQDHAEMFDAAAEAADLRAAAALTDTTDEERATLHARAKAADARSKAATSRVARMRALPNADPAALRRADTMLAALERAAARGMEEHYRRAGEGQA